MVDIDEDGGGEGLHREGKGGIRDEDRYLRRAVVAEVDQAEGFPPNDHILVAVVVEIQERGVAAPPDIDALVVVRLEHKRRRLRRAGVAVKIEFAGRLAHEQVEVAVGVDIDEGGGAVAASGQLHEPSLINKYRLGRGPRVAEEEHVVVPGAKEHVEVAVGVEVGEGGRVVVRAGDVERADQLKRGMLGRALVFEVEDASRVEIVPGDLVAQQQVEVAVGVEVGEDGDALAADVDAVEKALRAQGELVVLDFEEVEVIGGGGVGVEGAAEHPEEEVEVAVAVDIGEEGIVVAAGADRVFEGERHRFVAKHRRGARPSISNQQQAGLEEIAPEQVLVAVVVDVGEEHRVGPMQRAELRDDLDVLEPIRHEFKPGDLLVIQTHRLVAHHRAVDAADEEIHQAVAIDVGQVGDVLAIDKNGRAGDISERIDRERERGLLGRAFVAKNLDVAEDVLAQQVVVAVLIEIDEAIPFAHFDVVVMIGSPDVAGLGGCADVLEEHQLPRHLLHEQVEVAVGVDIDELGARQVEAAQERMIVGRPRGVAHLEGGHLTREGRRKHVRCVLGCCAGPRARAPGSCEQQQPEQAVEASHAS